MGACAGWGLLCVPTGPPHSGLADAAHSGVQDPVAPCPPSSYCLCLHCPCNAHLLCVMHAVLQLKTCSLKEPKYKNLRFAHTDDGMHAQVTMHAKD